MILELIFYSLSLSIMSMMSIEDAKTLKIDVKQILILWCVTTIYAIVIFKNISSLISFLFLFLIFTFLLIFDFSLGDYLVILSLWSFFHSVNEVLFFLAILFVLWFVVIIILHTIEHDIGLRRFFFKKNMPLLPIITISFLIWVVMQFIA